MNLNVFVNEKKNNSMAIKIYENINLSHWMVILGEKKREREGEDKKGKTLHIIIIMIILLLPLMASSLSALLRIMVYNW